MLGGRGPRGHFEEKTGVEMTERGIIRRMLN